MAKNKNKHVLAIASHVTYGYVGNKTVAFVLQLHGLDVSIINAVRYSNHTAYGQCTGSKTTREEVAELYRGLKQSGLDDFGILVSGYCPSADIVLEVGCIAREKRDAACAADEPGSFFWVLDPVMGDNGKIYVAEDTIPAFRNLIKDADLILPNQFEAELLSGVTIKDEASLQEAITTLHKEHHIRNIIITSVHFNLTSRPSNQEGRAPSESDRVRRNSIDELCIYGSTCTSDYQPRIFRIKTPSFPVFFSGTGDLFAALITAKLRRLSIDSGNISRASWCPPDEDLLLAGPVMNPLAQAAQSVMKTMHAVLEKTVEKNREVLLPERGINAGTRDADSDRAASESVMHLVKTKAAEVRIVEFVAEILHPPDTGRFEVESVVSGDRKPT